MRFHALDKAMRALPICHVSYVVLVLAAAFGQHI